MRDQRAVPDRAQTSATASARARLSSTIKTVGTVDLYTRSLLSTMLPSLSRHGNRRSIGRGVGILGPPRRARRVARPSGPTIAGGQLLPTFAGSKSAVTCGRAYKARETATSPRTQVGMPDAIRHAACMGSFPVDSAPGVTVDVHNRRACWGGPTCFLKIGCPPSKPDILRSR